MKNSLLRIVSDVYRLYLVTLTVDTANPFLVSGFKSGTVSFTVVMMYHATYSLDSAPDVILWSTNWAELFYSPCSW